MKAWTKYPNTIESDKLEKVPHIVEDKNGNQIEVLASDPLDAIALVTATIIEVLK